jgi:ribosomal protein L3
MGLETVTLKHRAVLVSDAENKIIGIKGPIPGGNGSLVYLTPEPAKEAKSTPKK